MARCGPGRLIGSRHTLCPDLDVSERAESMESIPCVDCGGARVLSQAAAAGLDWSDHDGDDDADFAEDESSYFIWCDALADADVAHTAQCGFAASWSSSSSDAMQAPVAEDLRVEPLVHARWAGRPIHTRAWADERSIHGRAGARRDWLLGHTRHHRASQSRLSMVHADSPAMLASRRHTCLCCL